MEQSAGVSLKVYLPQLSVHLGVSVAALYERQRSLTKLKVLPSIPGRGPKSGVRATPDGVAILLITALSVESLGEVAHRVRNLLYAHPTEMARTLVKHFHEVAHIESAHRQWKAMGKQMGEAQLPPRPTLVACEITGGSTFLEAVTKVLGSQQLASTIDEISVNRTLNTGRISSRQGKFTEFGLNCDDQCFQQMQVEARISANTISKIAAEVDVLSEVKALGSDTV